MAYISLFSPFNSQALLADIADTTIDDLLFVNEETTEGVLAAFQLSNGYFADLSKSGSGGTYYEIEIYGPSPSQGEIEVEIEAPFPLTSSSVDFFYQGESLDVLDILASVEDSIRQDDYSSFSVFDADAVAYGYSGQDYFFGTGEMYGRNGDDFFTLIDTNGFFLPVEATLIEPSVAQLAEPGPAQPIIANGNRGDDMFIATASFAKIFGGRDDDTIVTTYGRTVAAGGQGEDSFVFASTNPFSGGEEIVPVFGPLAMTDTKLEIKDFDSDEDTLIFSIADPFSSQERVGEGSFEEGEIALRGPATLADIFGPGTLADIEGDVDLGALEMSVYQNKLGHTVFLMEGEDYTDRVVLRNTDLDDVDLESVEITDNFDTFFLA